MESPLNFTLTDFLDKPFGCFCGEEGLVLGYVHPGGEEHPQCEDCVRKWTAAKDTPECAICRKAINASSVLTRKEAQKGAEKREQNRAEEFQVQYGEDERVAWELAESEVSPFDRFVYSIGGNDEDLARRLQAQELRKQNPFCNCSTYVIAAVFFVSGVILVNCFKS